MGRPYYFESEYRMVAAGMGGSSGFMTWCTRSIRRVESRSCRASWSMSRNGTRGGRTQPVGTIVESSNDAIIGETLEGVITCWNKSAERNARPPRWTMRSGARSASSFLKERSHELAQIIQRMRQGNLVEHLETVRVRKDGRQIHVSLVVSPIRDSQGKIVGVSAIAREITERKQLEAEVLQISEREQQRIAQDLHDGLGATLKRQPST